MPNRPKCRAQNVPPHCVRLDAGRTEVAADHAFPSCARLPGQRGTPNGDSRYSWTVDFAARRAMAREDTRPLLGQTTAARVGADDLKEKFKGLKKIKNAGPEIRIREQERAAHDQEAQASAIDATVFDLKAVHPSCRDCHRRAHTCADHCQHRRARADRGRRAGSVEDVVVAAVPIRSRKCRCGSTAQTPRWTAARSGQ